MSLNAVLKGLCLVAPTRQKACVQVHLGLQKVVESVRTFGMEC